MTPKCELILKLCNDDEPRVPGANRDELRRIYKHLSQNLLVLGISRVGDASSVSHIIEGLVDYTAFKHPTLAVNTHKHNEDTLYRWLRKIFAHLND